MKVPNGSEITPETLLRAYAAGIFPMAEGRNDPDIHWVDPRLRGVFPLDNFHISRRLAREIAKENYTIRTNTAFSDVVAACADRAETWISAPIKDLYLALHHAGFAQSLEVWREGRLIGGVYGVSLGAAFFGESMFSRATDASKIALAYLTHRLAVGGYRLFDTQFLTPHLKSLGAVEIPRAEYHRQLTAALHHTAQFDPLGYSVAAAGVLQRSTQTS
jgi:leucyl/phenylalanyl-tRNA---protein transferase